MNPTPTSGKQAEAKQKTVAQRSIEELIGEMDRLAKASVAVGNFAIGRLMERNAAHLLTETCQVFSSHSALRSENEGLREHLKRVTEELAELIKGEQDDKSVGITGWNSLHESVAAARSFLTRAASVEVGK